MQWHPIFAHLLRPLVESHYEVRTDQPVGDLPRSCDVVLLHKTAAGPAPFQGLWSRLTTWNVLEYKGPTVSARFDELHDLLELGLGIHRRLNELQGKEQLPEVDYPEVSFWYLVNHLGRRFLAEVPTYLPGIEQQAAGIWRAQVFAHPVWLVSVRELAVERDSLPLHVLAGVPETGRGTVVSVLGSEPQLLPGYALWLSAREPLIWKEILAMAVQQDQEKPLNLRLLAEYVRMGGRVEEVKDFLEAIGFERAIEAMGLERAIEAIGFERVVETVGLERAIKAIGLERAIKTVGMERLWEVLSAEQREVVLRLAQRDKPADTTDNA